MALSFDSSGDGGILSVDSHRLVPAPFLTKTYQLVDDQLTDDIVSWGEDGSTFVVWRPPEFARDLLPNYFKHNNFSSFVRQLNTYGFRKVVPDRWEFANDFFKKGERQLLCEIHRRKSSQACAIPGGFLHYGSSPTTSGEEHIAWSPLSSSPLQSPRGISGANSLLIAAAPTTGVGMPHQQHPVLSLSDENERLRRDNCLLMSELSRLQKQYDDAVLFLQQSLRLSVDDVRRLRPPNSSCNGFVNTATTQSYHPPQASSAPYYHQVAHGGGTSSSSKLFTGYGDFGSNSSMYSFTQPKFDAPAAATEARSTSGKLHSSDAAAPKASTIDFVDGKLRELNSGMNSGCIPPLVKSPLLAPDQQPEQQQQQQQHQQQQEHDNPAAATCGTTGPRLFGVLLHGKKRLHDEECSSDSGGGHKSPKMELELMPHSEAPWLKFRASTDAGVC